MKILPFLLVNEHSKRRYLTGADFDLESMQPIGDRIWFGDKFGPYLFATDLNGKVVAFYESKVDGKMVRSLDNHSLPSNTLIPLQTEIAGFSKSATLEGEIKVYLHTKYKIICLFSRKSQTYP